MVYEGTVIEQLKDVLEKIDKYRPQIESVSTLDQNLMAVSANVKSGRSYNPGGFLGNVSNLKAVKDGYSKVIEELGEQGLYIKIDGTEITITQEMLSPLQEQIGKVEETLKHLKEIFKDDIAELNAYQDELFG